MFPGVPIEAVVSIGTGYHDEELQQQQLLLLQQQHDRHHHENKDAEDAITTDSIHNSFDTKTVRTRTIGWHTLLHRVIVSSLTTEDVHETLHSLLPDAMYYRFNPPMPTYIPIDERNKTKLDALKQLGVDYVRNMMMKTNNNVDVNADADEDADHMKRFFRMFGTN